MSSRQKSFFEQDHGSKVGIRHPKTRRQKTNPRQSKARWQGNRSFDRKPSMNEATSKPAPPPKPPIQPSTETKSKLKAFEFARHPDKENDTSTTAPASPVKQLEAPSSPIKTVQDRPLPSTPAMRLPLADLIGNAEDALRRPTPQEESPVEEIGWIANSSHPDLTPRQRRRRPQSSSPVSSSQNDVADLPDANLPLSAFKTPKADPAAELWTRYATARNPDDTPIEKRIPSFAHLMNDSSPRSAPRTPGGSVGGLRRWASCGLEFPSSRVKRRRVNGIFRDNNNNNTDPGDLSAAKPLSRVGMLVEKVQESLAHKDLPSSSSPLPDKGEFPSVHMATSDHQQSQTRSERSSQQYCYQHEDTEFDDADITLDDIADIQPTAAVQNNPMSNTTIMNTIDEDDDEFGDDEFGDDLDVDEIENAVSFFESRPGTSNGQFTSQPNTCAIAQSHPPLPPSAPPPQQQQPQTFDLTGFSDDDDDDEFGGSDLDEEQFAQAEMAATQALEASTSASSSRAIQRYLVKQVIDGQYTDLRGRQQPEKDRVKATSRSSEPSVYGSMLHEIFQEAMKSNDWDQDSLNDLVGKTVGKYLESLFELGHEDTNKAFEHLKSKMPEMSSWAKVITKLLDVEEHVWSPTYGLKGNIDATVQVRMEDELGQRALTVPFEVKTGRNTTNTSHRAQTALYTLLLSDRYDLDVIYGLLYYMENSSVTRIPAIRHELRHMIMQRNELACYVQSQITIGEPIVISSEKGHFALANGYVTKLSKGRITVAVDRRLHNARRKQADFDANTNQTFSGIMEVGREDEPSQNAQGVEETPIIYRLDKDEFSNGMATVRNNLLALMDDNVFRSAELRKLIVENTDPEFKTEPAAYALSGPASQLQINKDQRAAIDKVMSAKDYALVLGMPGTGKTTTIAHIIRALVARGKSVLLTSYTHTAVDNILLKLRDSDASILRLGTLAKIHPEVQEFAHLAATPKQSMEELEDTYMKPQVVATTCLGVNHQLFQRRAFDYCIVDEASQITLPRKVVFANTDTLCPVPKETVMGSRIVNAVEATLLVQLVLSLIAQGISPTEIGVITFYRSQLALLRQLLKPYPEASGVEMHTADKFQGRDKEVVFISCVRSNDTGNVGDLLRDWRRINVAFTRARSKMVILGSKETLSANELLEKFLKLVDSKGWIYNLPKLAERGHNFQDTIGASLATQKTPAKTPAKKRDMEGDEEEGAAEAKKRRRHHNPHAQRKGIEDFLSGSAEKTVYHNENSKINKPFKVPEKVGKIGTKALFGKSQASGKRPVLMDIVNDALGGLE
ncbi:unnamed protein product [Aureobasidium pullulans]|nr:unnamed protein product [Aureobasidium pullulans]